MEQEMTPQPKTIKVVCSECGLDWEAHGPNPSLEKCVELLKAELAHRPTPSRPYQGWTGGTVVRYDNASIR